MPATSAGQQLQELPTGRRHGNKVQCLSSYPLMAMLGSRFLAQDGLDIHLALAPLPPPPSTRSLKHRQNTNICHTQLGSLET